MKGLPLQALVASKSIASASLHVPLPVQLHVYGAPFAVLYAGLGYVWLAHYDAALGSSEATFVWTLAVIVLHALSFLVCQWSVALKARLTSLKVTDPAKATCIVIIPTKHRGKGDICPLKRAVIRDSDGQAKSHLYFLFQKKKYIYSEEKGQFLKLDYPASFPHPISHFRNVKGLVDVQEVSQCLEKYGPNKFDIPIPTFQELFKEHAVAPFFVFQIFCVALWFLDDMWYYSLFTLFMLFVFESTVVFQRLRTLKEFRTMCLAPYPIYVHRSKVWSQVSCDTLLPGDLVSLPRFKDDMAVVPCDLLLVQGSCIMNEAMLSGESTPQLKESISTREDDEVLDVMGTHRGSVVFGGTKVLQTVARDSEDQVDESAGETVAGTAPPRWTSPDNGCIGYVLKTGFGTSQGKLVRTIIYSTERVTANNLESLLFILFLLAFAIVAAWYVWVEGTKNPDRKRNKVLLDCILIITSVVPPELPMELSLAVNNSLIALSKAYVFVTEPFRIPFAGKIDVACFDKTGTLTGENLLLEGVAGLPRALTAETQLKALSDTSSLTNTDLPTDLLKAGNLPLAIKLTLAGAHALVLLEDGIVGDPMEKSTLEGIQWTLTKGDVLKSKASGGHGVGDNHSLKVLRRYPFSSSLKRMSTISQVSLRNVNCLGGGKVFVACKGAPEVLKGMYRVVPKGYEKVYKYWARRGSRVLALGWKVLDTQNSPIQSVARDAVERDLEFAGLLIFYCPLKPDTKAAVAMLNNSSHRCVMITGDNALTALHVAEEVEIVKRETLILDVRDLSGLSWESSDESVRVPFSPTLSPRNPADLTIIESLYPYDLCITGRALEQIAPHAVYMHLIPRIWIYARVSPSQKELILTSLRARGYQTLMCGDGTNDVGALKQAHVGIALLDGKIEDMEKIALRLREKRRRDLLKQREELERRWGVKKPPAGGGGPAPGGGPGAVAKTNGAGPGRSLTSAQIKQQQLDNALGSMMDSMDDDVPTIKFGDASVAAPFTSKLSSVMSVCNIVRQGRSTLVAMIQMYKILALNCLISAYSMSVLYLAGIKQGDWQATVAGLLITVCFFSIAKSTPLQTLSKERPQTNIFNPYIVLSVLGQAAVHVSALIYIRSEAMKASEELDENIDLDAAFQPNLLNTGIYLVSLVMQISTFAINYQGHPFRESLRENVPLRQSLTIVFLIAFAAALEVSADLNSFMQLVELPDDFRPKLLACMVLDLGLSWSVEFVCKELFSVNKPKPSLLLNLADSPARAKLE